MLVVAHALASLAVSWAEEGLSGHFAAECDFLPDCSTLMEKYKKEKFK